MAFTSEKMRVKTELVLLEIGDKFYLPNDRKKKVHWVTSKPKWSNAGTSLIDCSDGKRRKKTTQVIKL